MARIRHGDVFAVPVLDGQFIFGRVMLDIAYCYRKKLLFDGSHLGTFRRECLVQMYEHISPSPTFVPSPILIPGQFIWPTEIGKSWPIVARGDVDCRMVEFPECLYGDVVEGSGATFFTGEIFIEIPISPEEYGGEDFQSTVYPPITWGYKCLYQLGREDEVPEEWRGCLGFTQDDLRYSPYRDQVYRYLPFAKDLSYLEKQDQLGYYFAGFYAQ